MATKIIRKAAINKRTKQLSVTIPKKELKATNPKLKFNEDIFVELRIVRRMRK